MKRTIKLMAMLLCVAALVPISSCEREDDPIYGENASSGTYPFTLGYYHPEKKLKKITPIFPYSDERDEYTIYFTWNGNNLDKITTYRRSDSYETKEQYRFTYNNMGYINTIQHYEETRDTEYDEEWEGYLDEIDSVQYYTLEEEGWGVLGYMVWLGSIQRLNSFSNRFYEYDNTGNLDGTLYGYNFEMNNGNLVQWYNCSATYDNKKNPFKNLIIIDDDTEILSGLFQFASPLARFEPFISSNNITHIEIRYGATNKANKNITYEYNGDYPIAIEYDGIRWELEYY